MCIYTQIHLSDKEGKQKGRGFKKEGVGLRDCKQQRMRMEREGGKLE